MLKKFVLYSLLLFIGSIGLNAQSVYTEALELANALENNHPKIIISSKTVQNINIKYNSGALPTVYKSIQAFPKDSLVIDEESSFLINQNPQPYFIQLVYDTLRSNPIYVPFNSSVTINNTLADCTIQYGRDTVSFTKYNFWKIHSILAANEYSDPAKSIHYNFSRSKNIYNQNPFIGPNLNNKIFQIRSKADSIKDVLIINSEAETINLNPSAEALSLLYVDSSLTAEDFLRIQQVVQDYQEPEVTNTDALQTLSASIQTNQNLSANYDYTTSLIAGLADFIAERAQEEFNYAFMQNFEEKLQEVPELGILFPKTEEFLENIELANYKTLLISARGAFTTDLDNLGLNLPKLLTLDKYKALETNSDIFNLLTVYSMVDLVYRGMAIDTIVPLTFQKFKERERELNKTRNIALAEKVYKTAALQEFIDSVDQLERILVDAKGQILTKQSDLLQEYTSAIAQVVLTSGDPEKIEAVKELYQNSMLRIDNLYNTQIRASWDTVAIIPDYLRGSPAYQYILKDPRIENFGKYFDQNPDTIRLIASGLELTKFLVEGVNGEPNKAISLRKLNRQINQSKKLLDDLLLSFNTDSLSVLRKAIIRQDSIRESLRLAVLADTSFWENAGASIHDIKALEYLAGTLQDFYYTDQNIESGPDSLINVLEARKATLDNIRSIIKNRLLEFYNKYQKATNNTYSPLLEKLTKPIVRQASAPTALQNLLNEAVERSTDIKGQLNFLNNNYCKEYVDAQQNAKNFAAAMELSSQLMYCIKGDPSDGTKWITNDEFNRIMSNDLSRDMYLGLIYQRVSDLKLSKDLSSDGVAGLITSIVAALGNLNITKDSIQIKKSLKQPLTFKDYFPFLKTTVQFVNNVITTPILVKDIQNPTSKTVVPTAIPLTTEYSALRNVPDISQLSVNLFENLSQKEYGQAIASFANLFEVVAKSIGPDCSLGKQLDPALREICEDKSNTIQKILKYGTFISDVAVAQSPGDIQTAFANASAPAGSSQVKRKNLYDVSLNAYFGMAFGRENLDVLRDNKFFPLNSISLTAPIGVSFSKKFGRNSSGSWTLFLSALDLGAVTAFRLNSDSANLPELNFQNIIAPGVFVYYNIGNSPFSVGGGWQYGPLLRKIEIDGELVETNASRILLSFAIDIPLFGLYTADGN
jgi:hypothetical protein